MTPIQISRWTRPSACTAACRTCARRKARRCSRRTRWELCEPPPCSRGTWRTSNSRTMTRPIPARSRSDRNPCDHATTRPGCRSARSPPSRRFATGPLVPAHPNQRLPPQLGRAQHSPFMTGYAFAHSSRRTRCSGVRPISVRGASSRGSMPRGIIRRRTAAGRPPTRWSSHHAKAFTLGCAPNQASTAASFHQRAPETGASEGSATAGQSRPGNGCMLARISALQLVSHQQVTPRFRPSFASREHRPGETRTGPNT